MRTLGEARNEPKAIVIVPPMMSTNQTIPAILVSVVSLVWRREAASRQARAMVTFCYEAGPCGYGLHRLLSRLGQDCTVVAPSLLPKKVGDRVKTNRPNAAMLARLHRAGELTEVWVPDAAHEAMREFGVLVPYIAIGPTLVAGAVTLGVMQQIVRAFGRVESSFQYLVNSWTTIVELISVYKRLRAFESRIGSSL